MLQTRTVEPRTLGLLKDLMSKPYLDQFFLVGGTALALQMGHRFSIDLDLFTLTDFDDAEEQADPVLFDPSVNWERIKSTLEREVKNLYS